jgi:hypothetical protein
MFPGSALQTIGFHSDIILIFSAIHRHEAGDLAPRGDVKDLAGTWRENYGLTKSKFVAHC